MPERPAKSRRSRGDESLSYPLFTEPTPIRSILPETPHVAPPAPAPQPLTSPVSNPPAPPTPDIVQIFEQEYRNLRPRAPMPPFRIRFRRFVSLNTTIRLREEMLHVSLSDILEGAPESVLRAIAHILIAKIYKKPIDPGHNNRYKRFQYSEPVARRTEQMRSTRGAKRILGPEGHYYHLDKVFDELNERFFQNLLGRPTLTWSEHHARRLLGHYDAAHNTIVVSKIFDRPSSPRYAIEYLLYHEMLHLKHPVSVRGTRRCVHSPAFRADEKRFPQLKEALAFLKRL